MAAKTKYTYAQLEQLWINAGGSKETAPVAAAIAEAESGGNSLAAYPGQTIKPGTGTNDTATGLWQILGVPPGFSTTQLTDPVANAQMAVAKYKGAGGNFSPWVTYTSGAYTAYLSNSTPPDATGVPTSTGAGGGGGGGMCVIGPVAGYCLLDKSQARALIGGALMTAGALIILPGLIILAASGFARSGAPGALGAAAGPLEKTPGYGTAIRAARQSSAKRTASRQGREAGERQAARSAARKKAKTAAP